MRDESASRKQSKPAGGGIRGARWAVLGIAAAGMLIYGSLASGGELSNAEKAAAVASSLRCPQCAGESVAESSSTVAREMRTDIIRRVESGQNEDEIRAVYAARYGEAVLLTPPAQGLGSLVWVIPPVAGALGVAALGLTLWYRRGKSAPSKNRPSWKRPVAVLVIIGLIAAGGGVALASSLGFRTSGDALTGDIRESTRGQLFTARELMAAREFEEADAAYAAVLSSEPGNAEALAWRGWLQFLQGEHEKAAESVSQATALDPDYPDALVFAAVIASRLGRYEEADEYLRAFDNSDAPPEMTALVDGTDLRSEIASELSPKLAEKLAALEPSAATGSVGGEAGNWADYDALAASVSPQVLARAAWILDARGHPVAAARSYQKVLRTDPDNLIALLGRGIRLTSKDFLEFSELFAEGVKALDRLVELAPQDPTARYWRALAAARQGRTADARADLGVLAKMEQPDALAEAADALREGMRQTPTTTTWN